MNKRPLRATSERFVRRVILVALLTLGGCREEKLELPPRATEEDLERLTSLGYLDHASRSEEELGVLHASDELDGPGLTLLSFTAAREIVILGYGGRIRHRWKLDARPGRSILLESGDLLSLVSCGERRRLIRLDWNGCLLWGADLQTHHDLVEWGADRLLVPSLRYLEDAAWGILPEGGLKEHDGVVFRDDGLMLIEPSSGKIISTRWFSSAFSDPENGIPFLPPNGFIEHDKEIRIDPFHVNSVFVLDQGLGNDRRIGKQDDLLVTFRNQNLIALFRWEPWQPVWWWGQGDLDAPHNASALPNGHVLVFDNRPSLGTSRVLEVDPGSGKIIWQFEGSEPGDFYSRTRGSAQTLRSGRILIGLSDQGRVLEISRSGELLWEWRNPRTDDEQRPMTFVRATRLEGRAIRRLLAKGIEPGPTESCSPSVVCGGTAGDSP